MINLGYFNVYEQGLFNNALQARLDSRAYYGTYRQVADDQRQVDNVYALERALYARGIYVSPDDIYDTLDAQIYAIDTHGYRPTFSVGNGFGYYDGSGFIGAIIGAEIAAELMMDAMIVSEGFYDPVVVIEEPMIVEQGYDNGYVEEPQQQFDNGYSDGGVEDFGSSDDGF